MTTPDSMTVFDRALVRRRRDRAVPTFAEHAFLFEEVAERLVDRLEDVARPFPTALDLGAHDGVMGRTLRGRKGVETLVACDLSPGFARRAGPLAVAADEELLPFVPETFDLEIGRAHV